MTEGPDALEEYTNQILSGATHEKKVKPKGTFKDETGSRDPVNKGKEAGQVTSRSGFPKGKVF